MKFLFPCFFSLLSTAAATHYRKSLDLWNQFIESPSCQTTTPRFILNWANRFFDPYLCPIPKATNCFYSCVQTSSHSSRANTSNGGKIKLSGSHSCLLRNELLASHTISKYVVPSTLSPDCLFARPVSSSMEHLFIDHCCCCIPPFECCFPHHPRSRRRTSESIPVR